MSFTDEGLKFMEKHKVNYYDRGIRVYIYTDDITQETARFICEFQDILKFDSIGSQVVVEKKNYKGYDYFTDYRIDNIYKPESLKYWTHMLLEKKGAVCMIHIIKKPNMSPEELYMLIRSQHEYLDSSVMFESMDDLNGNKYKL